jgi:hypothetical protein
VEASALCDCNDSGVGNRGLSSATSHDASWPPNDVVDHSFLASTTKRFIRDEQNPRLLREQVRILGRDGGGENPNSPLVIFATKRLFQLQPLFRLELGAYIIEHKDKS